MAETKVTGRELADDYSTNEVDTGRKWIDGKTIYRKTVAGTITFSANTRLVTTVSMGISGTVENIVDTKGFFDRGSSGSGKNIVNMGNGWEASTPGSMSVVIGGYFDTSTNNFVLVTKSDLAGTNKTYSVTLEYTKT